MRPYHVIKKHGQWHLYVGNDAAPIFVHERREAVVNRARGRARREGGQVIVHRPAEDCPPLHRPFDYAMP